MIRFIDFGIETLEIDFDDSHANQLYDFFLAHTDEFFELYSAFQDDLSRETLLSHILGNVSGKKSCLKNSITLRSVQYGFMPQNGGIVIDAGAYDGGIAAMFADFGYKVFSFEVDPEKFKIASKLAETKNFVVENIGLADFERDGKYFTDDAVKTMGFVDYIGVEDGIKSQNDMQNVPIKLTTIDEYVREKNLPRVDLMNLSVVGSELAVIRGAANTIARFKPIVILQCYQDLKDLIALYKTLKEIRPDYEFACRTGYLTPIEAKIMFSENVMKYCANFGLIPKMMDCGGLFLFAR